MSGINPAISNTSKINESTLDTLVKGAELGKQIAITTIEECKLKDISKVTDVEEYDLNDSSKKYKYARDLKVGQKIGENESLEYGYYSSDRSRNDTNELHLNTSIISGDSVVYRVVLLDENGNVTERFTEEDMKLEDLLEKYGKDKLVADVRDENGNPQAWIKVEDLLEGVEKIPIEEKEVKEEIKPLVKDETPKSNLVPGETTMVKEKEVTEEKANWYENIVNASKSINATRCSIDTGLVEGVGLFAEGVIDSFTMLGNHASNMWLKAGLKIKGASEEDINKFIDEKNNYIKDMVAETNVKNFFDENFFQEDGFLAQNSSPIARKAGNIAGEIAPFVGVTVATGGAAASAAAGAASAAGASSIGVAAAGGVAAGATVGGETFLATYGKDAETNFDNSMSYQEGTTKALVSSGIKSSIAAILCFAGEFISALPKSSNVSTSLSPIDDVTRPPSISPTPSGSVQSVGNAPSISPTPSGGTSSIGNVPLFEGTTTASSTAGTTTSKAASTASSTTGKTIPKIVNELKNGGKVNIKFNTATQFTDEAISSLDDVVNAVNDGVAEKEILDILQN